MPRNEEHAKYEAAVEAIAAACGAVAEFAKVAEGDRFEWEIGETAHLLGVAHRTWGKPGEVLYCNWRECLHANEPENRFGPVYEADKEGRSLLPGEGVQWFKGRIHPDCMNALRERRG